MSETTSSEETGTRIVVGVDGSDESKRALAWSVDEARLRGLPVAVAHAWHRPYLGVEGAVPLAVADDAVFEQAASAVLDEALATAAGSDVQLERHLIEGPPAPVLLELSATAALLVLGSRGLGGFKALLLGSVTQHCVQHATCPVVVVR